MPRPSLTKLELRAIPAPDSDVRGDISTTANVIVGQPVYGHFDADADGDWYSITLEAGRTYDFRLLGVGYTPARDTLLRLRDSAGNVILAGGGTSLGLDNPSSTFTAPKTGIYFVETQGDQGQDFLLSVANHNNAGLIFTADEIAWQLTNNYERYAEGKDTNVASTSYWLSDPRTIAYSTLALTADGAKLASAALQQWSDVTGIQFVANADKPWLSFDDSGPGSDAYTDLSTGFDGSIANAQVMVTTGWLSDYGTGYDSYSFQTYVHEIGHALGLGHAGNYNGSATYGTDNYYLNDSLHLSIMSYMFAQYGDLAPPDYNTFVNARFGMVLTPMVADIVAMQTLYGLSTTTRTGDTHYGYHSNTGNAVLDDAVNLNDPKNNNFVAFTIFDCGGRDTVDMSGYGGAQRITLSQGSYSDVLGGRINMGIARGTILEDATGGTGADKVSGNGVANRLIGGGGADQLSGGAGNDTLLGGIGKDVMTGGVGKDAFLFNAFGDKNADAIVDYSVADDTIRLNHAVFAALSTGALSTNAYVANLTGMAEDANDRILFETDSGRAYYDPDGIGAADRVLFATLAPNLHITNADFLVV